jgi:hypothetical protein
VKGKHQRARHNRLAHATAAELQRLRDEIAVEADRSTAARVGAEQTRVARQRLAREQATTDSRLQPQQSAAARIVRSTMQAMAAVTAARAELEAVERELTPFNDDTVQELRQSGVRFNLRNVHSSADPRFVDTWYRKKTRGGELKQTRDVSLKGWVPDGIGTDKQVLRPFAMTTVADTSPQACWTWAVPPWLRPAADRDDAPWLRERLGAATSGTPVMPPGPYPGPPRRGTGPLSTPWRHAPLIAEPADAADLTYWYQRSGWAQQWKPGTAPVPFWLPAEHAVAYPQAGPLPDGTDIRLPYPAVFAVFSAGWQLEAHRTGELPPQLATAQLLMLHARGRAATLNPMVLSGYLLRLQATGLMDRGELPTPLEALEAFGGVVDGLLLYANPDGTPRDEFAWCIAIGHPTGFPIARITVPASRTTTSWRTQIDNITAGIALSCWHDPAAATDPAGRQTNPEPGPADVAIHVLDIDATSPPVRASQTTDPAYSTRPHLRRGHWRQQRVGEGRRETRWTWIRPTAVNGRPATLDQVYVLH